MALLALCTALVIGSVFGLSPTAHGQFLFGQTLAQQEAAIGERIAQRVIAEYGPTIILDPADQRTIDTVFSDLVAHAERQEIAYTLTILGSEIPNAFAAPGGYTFITLGLLRVLELDPDMLANVLGHEIAHVDRNHGMDKLRRNLQLDSLLQSSNVGVENQEAWERLTSFSFGVLKRGWNRDQEHEADEHGQYLAARAGYDPMGMARFLRSMQEVVGRTSFIQDFFSSHPVTPERITRAHSRATALTSARETRPTPATPVGVGSRNTPRSADTESLYSDLAERFTITVPEGWQVQANISENNVVLLNPTNEDLVFISVYGAGHLATDSLTAAHAHLGFSRDSIQMELEPRTVRLGDKLGAHAQYRDDKLDEAQFVAEYYVLADNSLYVIRHERKDNDFSQISPHLLEISTSLVPGRGQLGRLSYSELSRGGFLLWTMWDAFTMPISTRWFFIEDVSPPDYSLANFKEFGTDGMMTIFRFDVEPGVRALDFASEWVEKHATTDPLAPLYKRSIGGFEAVSFLHDYPLKQNPQVQYGTIIIHNSAAYVIEIYYGIDDFYARKHIFDQWLDNWRPIGAP